MSVELTHSGSGRAQCVGGLHPASDTVSLVPTEYQSVSQSVTYIHLIRPPGADKMSDLINRVILASTI